MREARNIKNFKEKVAWVSYKVSVGVKFLVKKRGPTFNTRLQRSAKVALTLL